MTEYIKRKIEAMYTTTGTNTQVTAEKDYPPYLDYPKERTKQTNGDKIRQMTDEMQKIVDEDLPTVDAVHVVRCRYCEYWARDWEPNHSDGNQHFCPMLGLVTDADFFCKDGEREGGNE